MKLSKINFKTAEQLFNDGITIYVKDVKCQQHPESSNTFMLSNRATDAAINIYGFNELRKVGTFNDLVMTLESHNRAEFDFYTFNSKELLIIDNNL